MSLWTGVSLANRMLIINADDWGRSVAETDAALRCYKGGRTTSVSAMVFMEDSERAAELAKENELDGRIASEFYRQFTANPCGSTLANHHDKIVRFSFAETNIRNFCTTPFCEQNLSTHTKHRRRSSGASMASRRHTSTDITICIFVLTFFSATRFQLVRSCAATFLSGLTRKAC